MPFDCATKIHNAYGEEVPLELHALINKSKDRIDKMFGKYHPDIRQEFRALVDTAMSRKQISTLMRMDYLKFLNDNIDRVYGEGSINDKAVAIRAIIEGAYVGGKGAKYSVFGVTKRQMQFATDILSTKLESKGLTKHYLDPTYDVDVATELFNRTVKGSTLTTNKIVSGIADAVESVNKFLLMQRRLGGSLFKESEGFIFRLVHDNSKILNSAELNKITDVNLKLEAKNASIAKWVDYTIDKLDWEKSFGIKSTDNNARIIVAKVLGEMADSLNIPEENAFKGKSFYGGKKKLNFKSGKDFMDYTKEYGVHKTMSEGVNYTIKKSSTIAAAESLLGSNPEQMIEDLIKFGSMIDPSLKTRTGGIYNALNIMRGVGDTGKTGMSNFLDTALSITAIQRMGRSGPKQIFVDAVPYVISSLTAKGADGMAYFAPIKLAANVVSTIKNMFPSGDHAKLMRAMQVAADAQGSYILRESGVFDSDLSPRGRLSKVVSWYHKLNLMKSSGEARRYTAAQAHSSILTDLIQRENIPEGKQGSLSPRERDTISTTGLNSDEMDIIRSFIKEEKLTFFDLEHFHNEFPDSDIKARIQDKVGSYNTHVINESSAVPGWAEERMMFRHLPKGHLGRMAVSLLAQFQGATLSVLNTTAQAARRAGRSDKLMTAQGATVLGNYVLMSTASAILWKYLDEELTGKDHKDVTVDYVANAMWKTIPIPYLDMLSAYNSKTGELQLKGSSTTPPTIQSGLQLFNMLSKYSSGQDEEASKLLKKNLPFGNMWFNYMLFSDWMEDK